MIDRLKEELKGLPRHFAVLVISNKDKLNDTSANLLNIFSEEGISGSFVALETPYSSLKTSFKKKGVDFKKLNFVGLPESGSIKSFKGHDLLALSFMLDTLFKSKKEKFIIFDSLDDVLKKNDPFIAMLFTKFLVDNAKENNTKCIIEFCGSLKEKKKAEELGILCDKVIDLS